MFRLRSLRVQAIISQLMVTLATVVVSLFIFWSITAAILQNQTISLYNQIIAVDLLRWMMGFPDGQPIDGKFGEPDGFSLIVQPDNATVAFSYGETNCRAGDSLAACAPQLLSLSDDQRFIEIEGEKTAQITQTFASGHRIIMQRGRIGSELSLFLGDEVTIYGNVPFIAIVTLFVGGIAIPVGVALSSWTTRRLLRRLSHLTQTSRAFAEGDFNARTGDTGQDEIGRLAQQFDAMADVLQQNIDTLRDLAESNSKLLRQVEQTTAASERLRLARDLHDSLAQKLFSLSFNASALPELIAQGSEKSQETAQRIATMAEDAQLDLRSMIVDMRPGQNGAMPVSLTDLLEAMADQWQRVNNIPVEVAVVLHSQGVPAGIQETIYRVTQEALNNVAKHAGASGVSVTVLEGRSQVTLSVTDDGQGFDMGEPATDGSFGIVGMRERARSLGGTVTIDSTPERGTTVRLVLPLNEEALETEA